MSTLGAPAAGAATRRAARGPGQANNSVTDHSPHTLRLDNVWENGLLTGLWLRDEEGVLHTADLNVVFERGRPVQMVAILVLKSVEVWSHGFVPLRSKAARPSLAH